MKPNQEPVVKTYVSLIRSSDALHTSVTRGLAIEGLSASKFSAMKALRIYGKLAQRDIAKYILRSCGNITVLVDNLEEEGLAQRDRDTLDRRIVYVSLTQKGEDVFDRLYPSHLCRIREAMAGLTEAECEQLASLLNRLAPDRADVACMPAKTLEPARR